MSDYYGDGSGGGDYGGDTSGDTGGGAIPGGLSPPPGLNDYLGMGGYGSWDAEQGKFVPDANTPPWLGGPGTGVGGGPGDWNGSWEGGPTMGGSTDPNMPYDPSNSGINPNGSYGGYGGINQDGSPNTGGYTDPNGVNVTSPGFGPNAGMGTGGSNRTTDASRVSGSQGGGGSPGRASSGGSGSPSGGSKGGGGGGGSSAQLPPTSRSRGVTGSTGSNQGHNQSNSFIPDYEPQMGFLTQFGNMAGDLANQQYDWAQQQFGDNQDLTDQNINSYLSNSDLAGQSARRDNQNYNNIFNPAASSLNNDWQSYTSPERVASEMGRGEAGVAQNFEAQRKNTERDLQSYGINPSDPRYASAVAASRTAEGASGASAGNQARLATEATGRGLRSQALGEAHLLPGQQATEQNVAMQGNTGAQNAAMTNTSLGALTMGTTRDYLNAGIANNKFQPLGTNSYGDTSGNTNSFGNNQSQSDPSLVNPLAFGNNNFQGPSILRQPFAQGGAIPDDDDGGGYVPASMSPSGGQATDDIPATVQQTGGQAAINAGEFVIPKDVVEYNGHKFFQDLIAKARKARTQNPGPAHPTMQGGVQHHASGGDPGAMMSNMAGPTAQQPMMNMAGPTQQSGGSSWNWQRPGNSMGSRSPYQYGRRGGGYQPQQQWQRPSSMRRPGGAGFTPIGRNGQPNNQAPAAPAAPQAPPHNSPADHEAFLRAMQMNLGGVQGGNNNANHPAPTPAPAAPSSNGVGTVTPGLTMPTGGDAISNMSGPTQQEPASPGPWAGITGGAGASGRFSGRSGNSIMFRRGGAIPEAA